MSLLKHNQHLITFSLGFFAITNMSKQTHSYGSQNNCNILSQGSRAQLKQTLTSIMVIQTTLLTRLTLDVDVLMFEAGDAVCGVV